MMPLRLEISKTNGSAQVNAHGEVDMACAEDLVTCVDELVRAGVRDVHLDLGGVTFMDSAGLRALHLAALSLDGEGGSLVLMHPSTHVERVLALTGTRERFRIAGDRR